MSSPLVFISAGDPSGDNAGSLLITALKKQNPATSFIGLGGARMRENGQQQLVDISKLAVMGFLEVVLRLHFFRKLFNQAVELIKNERPDCLILIDYPGFNLRLAKAVKELGIPIIYYISPQVWAWGEKRIQGIKANVDRLIVILPFEQKFYQDHGIKCDFVGHYLLEDIPDRFIRSSSPTDGHIAVLPGSRDIEIKRMLPPMLKAVKQFNTMYGTKAVVTGIRGAFDYDKLISKYREHNVSLVYNDARKVIYESSLVLTKSGTATLETAIIGRPMVVVYKTGMITFQIAQWLVKLDQISLVNLVLGEKVVPELIQFSASAMNMFLELERFYNDENYYEVTKNKLDRLAGSLGGRGASARAADIIAEYL